MSRIDLFSVGEQWDWDRFIDLHLGNFHWFVFNVADIFITVGIIGLIMIELLKREKVSDV